MDKFCKISTNSHSNNNYKYLLSTSLFFLENSYKSALRYINGIRKIIEFITKYDDIALRIYFDNSIYNHNKFSEFINDIKNNKNLSNGKVQLVEYSCSPFMKGSFHIGTFGTLMRFLPLFENSHYKVIHILDIDDLGYDYIAKFIDKFQETNKYLVFYDIDNYNKRYDDKLNTKYGYCAIANIYLQNYRYDIKLLINFLDSINNSDDVFNMLENINTKFFTYKQLPKDILRTYGIDEYFLNIYLINNMKSDKIGCMKESLYLDYFIDNLVKIDDHEKIVKNYFIDILSLLKFNKISLLNKSSKNLKDILSNIVKINDNTHFKFNRKIFLNNYFKFNKEYKKITLNYYKKYFFIFDEKFIDDFINNDFNCISWYIKKFWSLFPTNITDNLVIVINDNPVNN